MLNTLCERGNDVTFQYLSRFLKDHCKLKCWIQVKKKKTLNIRRSDKFNCDNWLGGFSHFTDWRLK